MLRKEKQLFFMAPNASDPLHAQLLALYPALPFADFAFDDFSPSRIASRIRCGKNQAVLYWTSSVRCSWRAEMPFCSRLSDRISGSARHAA